MCIWIIYILLASILNIRRHQIQLQYCVLLFLLFIFIDTYLSDNNMAWVRMLATAEYNINRINFHQFFQLDKLYMKRNGVDTLIFIRDKEMKWIVVNIIILAFCLFACTTNRKKKKQRKIFHINQKNGVRTSYNRVHLYYLFNSLAQIISLVCDIATTMSGIRPLIITFTPSPW